MTPEQRNTEQSILRLTKDHRMPKVQIHSIIDNVRNIIPPHRNRALTKAHKELTLLQEERRNPLHRADFATISMRPAVAVQHFIRKIEPLPIPTRMKSCLNDDLTAPLTNRVFGSRNNQVIS